ncbi:hypothetical protein I5L51_19870 [Pseudomonas mendocina]|nr:hypothetical protein [Pseudomonas mendocina]
MVKKILFVSLAGLLLGACSNQAVQQEQAPSATENDQRLVGIWAMLPLRNGIANVAEYRADGKVLLHSFNCAEPDKRGIEESDYRFSEDGRTIHVSSPQRAFDLQVLDLQPNSMRLGMQVAGFDLNFSYLKRNEVAPLCALYVEPQVDESKQSAFKASDFVAAPVIPAHADIERYMGRWVDENGEVQVEVIRDSSGRPKLHHASDKNWHYLFNGVNWQGDELHYQSFAYSDQPRLFSHSYHKSQHRSILSPQAETGKIRYSFFIGQKRFDYILMRAR